MFVIFPIHIAKINASCTSVIDHEIFWFKSRHDFNYLEQVEEVLLQPKLYYSIIEQLLTTIENINKYNIIFS